MFIAKMEDQIAIMEKLRWKDEKGIFQTLTKHLRKMQEGDLTMQHVNIQKWTPNLQLDA